MPPVVVAGDFQKPCQLVAQCMQIALLSSLLSARSAND
jgi:hypothetical protein